MSPKQKKRARVKPCAFIRESSIEFDTVTAIIRLEGPKFMLTTVFMDWLAGLWFGEFFNNWSCFNFANQELRRHLDKDAGSGYKNYQQSRMTESLERVETIPAQATGELLTAIRMISRSRIYGFKQSENACYYTERKPDQSGYNQTEIIRRFVVLKMRRTSITRISRKELKSSSYRGLELSKSFSKRGSPYENSTYSKLRSTRSFDFEIELTSGVVHTFSSIEKEEYGKLFDFITSKKLRVKNRGKSDKLSYDNDFGDSDQGDEPDAYLARVKAEAQERDAEDNQDSEEESTDEDFNPNQDESDVAEEYDSNPNTSESENDSDASGKSQKKDKKEKKEKKDKKSKSAKTVHPDFAVEEVVVVAVKQAVVVVVAAHSSLRCPVREAAPLVSPPFFVISLEYKKIANIIDE
ncbi:uncharacterized protein LOC143218551 [Lasioglossum baleicum]|uniref:uncharacterized protein LOC143218551 n=1 Tax=Lasioglossum baleicum TaxID=434251 RepID=UPI003FCD659F